MIRILMVGDVAPPERLYHVGDEACFNEVKRRLTNDVPSVVSLTYGRPVPDTRESKQRFRDIVEHRLVPTDIEADLQHCDAVWFVGGGNLNSIFPSYLYHRLSLLAGSSVLQKPVIATGQTLGPFTSEDLGAFREVAGLFSFLSVRDRIGSVEEAIAARCHGLVSHDDAFFLPHNEPKVTGISERRVGLSMRDWDDSQTIAFIKDIFERLPKPFSLKLIPHIIARDDGYDISFMAKHFAGEPFRFDHFSQHGRFDKEVKGLTAGVDCLISTRYHGAVFAASLGIPCLAVFSSEYYRRKLKGLASLNYPKLMVKSVLDIVSTADLEWLISSRKEHPVASALDLNSVLQVAIDGDYEFTPSENGVLAVF